MLSGLGFAAGRWRLLLTARSERRDDRRLAVDVPYTRLGSWRANGFIRPADLAALNTLSTKTLPLNVNGV